MSDDEAKTPRLFDVRTIDRNIRKGLTTRKDYDKYLKTLPDVAEKAAPTETGGYDEDGDLDDDDFDDEDEDDDMDDDTTEAKVAAETSDDAGSNNVPDGHGSPSNDNTA